MTANVKLSTADHRAWRTNKSQWVSPEGVVMRAVTPEEENALFPIVQRTKMAGKTQVFDVVAVYKRQDAQGRLVKTERPMRATVRVTKQGRQQNEYLLNVYVNGCRYVKGREIIQKRLLAQHGECILSAPNGKRLCLVRNPEVKRPSYHESQRSAPHPRNCQCAQWGARTDDDRHHPTCEWNAKAPPHERALPFQPQLEAVTLLDGPDPIAGLAFDPRAAASAQTQIVSAARQHRAVLPAEPPLAPAAPAAPVAPAAVYARPTAPSMLGAGGGVTRTRTPPVKSAEIYPPERCPDDCRGLQGGEAWNWPRGKVKIKGEHHPLCPHDDLYRKSRATRPGFVLVEIMTGEAVREATDLEVTQAEIEYKRTGTRSLMIAGRIYGVQPAGDAPRGRVTRPIVSSSAAPTADAQARRRALLAESGLPAVPEESAVRELPPDDRDSIIAELRRQIAALEGRGSSAPQAARAAPPAPVDAAIDGETGEALFDAELGAARDPEDVGRPEVELYDEADGVEEGRAEESGVAYGGEAYGGEDYGAVQDGGDGAGVHPWQPEPEAVAVPYRPLTALSPLPAAPVVAPADFLRDPRGLVGHQQATDDIAPGPVRLTEPTEFVDPLLADPMIQTQAPRVVGGAAPAALSSDPIPSAPGEELTAAAS